MFLREVYRMARIAEEFNAEMKHQEELRRINAETAAILRGTDLGSEVAALKKVVADSIGDESRLRAIRYYCIFKEDVITPYTISAREAAEIIGHVLMTCNKIEAVKCLKSRVRDMYAFEYELKLRAGMYSWDIEKALR